MPSIHKVYSKLEQTGLAIFLVDIQEARSTVQGAVQERGYTLPVLLDKDGTVTQTYRVRGTPTVYLIDTKGYLVVQAVGPRDWDSAAGLKILKSLNRQ